MITRVFVAEILLSRTLIEPLTDKQICAMIPWGPSSDAVGRARRWCEREYKRDRLKGLQDAVRSLKQEKNRGAKYLQF